MYIELPDLCFAYNAKVGCTSFSRAIISRYFPEHEEEVAKFFSYNRSGPISYMLAKKKKYATKPVVLLVRDPIDRFLSAINQVNIFDVDSAIDALERKSLYKLTTMSKPVYLYQDIHFVKQSSLLSHVNHLFRFPDHIEHARDLLQIGQLELLNKSLKVKQVLNDDQIARINDLYKVDLELFNYIDHPGIIIKSRAQSEWDKLFAEHFIKLTNKDHIVAAFKYQSMIFKCRTTKMAIREVSRFLRDNRFMHQIVVKDIIDHSSRDLGYI